MDSTSQTGSDGGGGRRETPYDERRPQTDSVPPDPGPANGQLLHARAPLPLDQIRVTGSSNEYTDGPAAAQRSPASEHRQQNSDVVTPPGSRTNGRPENLSEPPPLTQHGNATNTLLASGDAALQSPSAEDAQSGIGTGAGATSSTLRLLASPAGGRHIVRAQPKHWELQSEELKPLHATAELPGSPKSDRVHSKCEECGRCRCPECRRPQALPSCWMCGRRCVCSAHSAVDYGTCACCVKALFYHCSSDDEDTCADKPFSCEPPHCCVRWTAASLLALLFPCLLCYLPAKGCADACQSCYVRAARPGCRC